MLTYDSRSTATDGSLALMTHWLVMAVGSELCTCCMNTLFFQRILCDSNNGVSMCVLVTGGFPLCDIPLLESTYILLNEMKMMSNSIIYVSMSNPCY